MLPWCHRELSSSWLERSVTHSTLPTKLTVCTQVNLSCSPSYPTDVTVSFSCVPGSLPSVRHVYIGTNGSTEEIRSDAVETGHIGCNVTVTTSNLSGKNISELFTFGKLCVGVCSSGVATPGHRPGQLGSGPGQSMAESWII